jgi:hypothetical protein
MQKTVLSLSFSFAPTTSVFFCFVSWSPPLLLRLHSPSSFCSSSSPLACCSIDECNARTCSLFRLPRARATNCSSLFSLSSSPISRIVLITTTTVFWLITAHHNQCRSRRPPTLRRDDDVVEHAHTRTHTPLTHHAIVAPLSFRSPFFATVSVATATTAATAAAAC